MSDDNSRAAARVALVTGGASGIGLGVVDVLSREGFHCIVASRKPERAKHPGATTISVDITNTAEVARLGEEVARVHGRLDLLVNSAGIVSAGKLDEQSEEAIEAQLSVNVRGTILVTRACLGLIRAAKGVIVNLGSTLAHRPVPGVSIYAASKGAIEGFTRALAADLAPDGVRVYALLPALVRSEIWTAAGMTPDAYDALLAARAKEYPLGRAGEPADVAEMVAFLASDRAAWMTGTCIPIDGGIMLGPRRA